jgi:hypothetical protein
MRSPVSLGSEGCSTCAERPCAGADASVNACTDHRISTRAASTNCHLISNRRAWHGTMIITVGWVGRHDQECQTRILEGDRPAVVSDSLMTRMAVLFVSEEVSVPRRRSEHKAKV